MDQSIPRIEGAIRALFDRQTAEALKPYASRLLSRAREGYQHMALQQEIARCHQDADINLDQVPECGQLAALLMEEATRTKRPADVIGNAVHVMKVLTGEADDETPPPVEDGKDPAAKALGAKGGAARAKAMSPERRSEIAKKAAAKRWEK